MAEALTQTQTKIEEPSQLEALVAYLRAHPFKFDHSKSELAAQFGLSEEFVGDVLETLKGSPNKARTRESVTKAVQMMWNGVSTTVMSVGRELTEKPFLAIPVTTVLAVALMFLARAAANYGLITGTPEQIQSTMNSIGGTVGVTLLLLHALVYARHGMIRFAAFGAGTVLAVVLPLILMTLSQQSFTVGNEPVPEGQRIFYAIVASVIMATTYFMFATVCSLAGGFYKTSRADRKEMRLSRQELIDRLFFLQERLRAARVTSVGARKPSLAETLRVTPWLPIYSILFGLGIGLFTVFLRGTFADPQPTVAETAVRLDEFVGLTHAFLMGVCYVSLGYFSGGIRRSLIALTLVFAGSLVAELVPYKYFGPEYFEYLRSSGELLDGLANTLIVALVVGVGAHIDKRARVRRKLQEHDPAFVLAEIVEIQWRLNPTAASSCVAVVDVAGSTRMKADADHLAVEYSFRAFHTFIEQIGARRGGSVISTAGDAAVLTFASCAEALYAAKEIQSEIERFNSRTNRLESPFRVRIGIHTGNVSAQLRDVPFNELIDIAAHVEKEAPVGGIALTQAAVENLQDERVAALKDQVDGQNVFLVLDPTLAT